MIDKLSNQSRIIIATVLSISFLAAYNYFFAPKQDIVTNKQIINEKNNTIKVAPASSDLLTDVPVKHSVEKKETIIATIKAEKYEIKIDRMGRISKFYLNEDKYTDEDNERIQLISSKLAPHPLEIRFSDTSINEKAFQADYKSSAENIQVKANGSEITLTQSLDGLEIKKIIKFLPLWKL